MANGEIEIGNLTEIGRRDTPTIGYVVLAKRPDERLQSGYDYQPAGSVWADRDPVENHQAYCEMSAEANPDRYGDVQYVIGRIELDEESK